MKCGIEIDSSSVFCESCLAEMDKYPVKPDTRILLPNHPAPEATKKQAPKKRQLTTKEKLKKSQQVLKWVTVALVVSLLLLGYALYMLFEETAPEDPQDNIGQNYSTIGDYRRSN